MQPFHIWHEETLKKRKPTTLTRLWVVSITFGLFCLICSLIYTTLSREASGLEAINRALAASAILTVGMSFVMSGLCYFWDFVDTKIIYRKYVGIVGLDFALLHGALSWYLYASPEHTSPAYTYHYLWSVGGLHISNATSAVFGFVALAILIIMFMSSRSFIMPRLGGKRWREILRTGYIALFLAIFHFGIKQYDLWQVWFNYRQPSNLPPLSLLLIIFIVAVLALRLSLQVALTHHNAVRKQQTPPPNQSAG